MLRLRPILAAVAVATTLAACGGAPTPPEPEPFTIGGTVLDLTGVPLPINVSYMTALPEALGVAGVAPAAVNQFPNGTLELASTLLSADGAFELVLPDGDDIPSAFLADATVFLVSPGEDVTCTASADGEAQVLRTYFLEGFAVPYTFLGPFNDLSIALGVLMLGDGLPTFGATDLATYAWTYATAPVSVAGACTFDDGIAPVVQVGVWDLDLEAGWNRLRFDFDAASGTTTVDTGTIDGARWRAFLP